MDMVTMFLVLSEVEKDTAAGYDQAAAYYIGDASEQSAATFGRAQKRGADYGMLNGNGAAFINAEIIGALTSGKASASNSATTTSAAYVKIEAYYKLLYTQATLKYAHSIDEAIEHEDADEMAEMIGEGYAFWRTLRPWVKAWDTAQSTNKADIIDDIYDTRRAPRGEPYTVQGSNYYTYCHVKKILDEFVETLPSGVQAHYGTYDEADDVECLKSGSGGSVAYAASDTITDHDDLFMETGIGGITVAGLTYTPSSNIGASLYFSEAVKKTLQTTPKPAPRPPSWLTTTASASKASLTARNLATSGPSFPARITATTPQRGSPTSWTRPLSSLTRALVSSSSRRLSRTPSPCRRSWRISRAPWTGRRRTRT